MEARAGAAATDPGRYRERASSVPGAVLWRRITPPGSTAQRVLPDGCMDLIWADGELMVAGPDTEAQLGSAPAGTRYVGLRFAPGTGPAILGTPAHELRNRRVALADLWPAVQVRRLAGHLHSVLESGEMTDVGAAMEQVAGARYSLAGPPDPAVAQMVTLVRAGLPAAGVAVAAGISERQLLRRCLAAFGYGPKTLGRILRMNHAVDLARIGTPFATVAATAGYADQAHLAREVRALAGVPLSVLLS
ncbi:helix-turn-helix domain-containing protein [Planotetraspora kaengkrachanensis]|uniref:AraC family transcriptional regulator n=1 Tax=Planotetraspora kaengkrachanensis TaxID=575193 RepID=A0A8J3PZ43_9ACTN|nr:helix-turn-helix domain-containing protein [Planotetraspora kaengkrachanensis]GIG83523.1 AraC family transcriptional regulator [Planotetraspora kaengkrachanensis]